DPRGPHAHDDDGGAPADRLGAALTELTELTGPSTSRARTRELLGEVATLVGRRAKTAGVGAVGSGRFLADLLLDAAEHLPARDVATLTAHHHGLQGEALAEALERNAARTTAAVG